ncbi:MAG: ATP cone domain-containing protein [Candidatus Roizmanbacteria bacterium]|nr:ATP cone domain-containing protein [Candidatus Roizmanbacteria bacterium]
MKKYIVIKRDGSKEIFSEAKIARVMGAAGLTSEQTKQVVNQVNEWLTKQGQKEITSLSIRDVLLTILPEINKPVADLFTWYQKTKEK